MKVSTILAFASTILLVNSVSAEPATVASITDGDTFRTMTGERIRIAAVDAPETYQDRARCLAEIKQGRAATVQLHDLIDGREVDLMRVGKSYDRTVAIVHLNGRDVAGEMIRRGAAKPWPRRSPKPDWCGMR